MTRKEEFAETYSILGKLGEGSGGIVYKAFHKRLRTPVVLKMILAEKQTEEYYRNEVDILKKLRHSYLPQVLDFLELEDGIYIAMTFIPGKSFQQLMREGDTFTQNQLIRWGMQICSALDYLHSQKPPIIHGDIKPDNIMLTPEGNICLIDFNVSFFLNQNISLGYTKGYTSPEQNIFHQSYQSRTTVPDYIRLDQRTDIYSVGATFYHILMGEKIRDYNSELDFRRLAGKSSRAFAQVIKKAVKNRPEERYQSAREMFLALQKITQKDKRYKSLLRRQHIFMGLWLMLLAASFALSGFGMYLLQQDRILTYEELVEQQTAYRENGDYEKEQESFEKALQTYPFGLETYYQQAYTLYEKEDYEACIAFIDQDILGNKKLDLLEKRLEDIYYLKADSYYRLENYEKSVGVYEELFELQVTNAQYYRDYAIALAYTGAEEAANEILEQAIEKGLAEDSIYYAKGEIGYSLKNFEEAITQFSRCVQSTEDTELLERSYILLSKIYEEQGQLDQDRNILMKAQEVLPAQSQMIVLERLAQVNIDLAEKSGENWYREEAVAALNKIIEQGWDSKDTYDNLAILHEKMGNLEEVGQVLRTMEEKYGEDYNLYKRYAFLEIDIQERKPNESRDYQAFADYYQKAEDLYYKQLKDNNTDPEMGLLENTYQQILAGGWLT